MKNTLNISAEVFPIGTKVVVVEKDYPYSGDMVFQPGLKTTSYGLTVKTEPYTISDIRYAAKENKIEYLLDEGTWFNSADVFPTYEEAKAECDRRNGGRK